MYITEWGGSSPHRDAGLEVASECKVKSRIVLAFEGSREKG